MPSTAVQLLKNKTLLNETSQAVGVNNSSRVGLRIVWPEGCNAGTVVLERAPNNSFSGTWETVLSRSVPASAPGAGGEVTTDGTDIVDAGVMRARITSAVTGGAGGAGVDVDVIRYRDDY